MTIRILKKSDYKTTNWSGGTTTEILIYPDGSTLDERNFDFRVSSATCLSEKSLFSDFSGYNRYITSLDNELILFNQGEKKNIKPYQIFFFDGDDETYSQSSVTDFNLIIKKGLTGSLRSESINDATLRISDGINLIFFPEGQYVGKANGERFELESFDALLVTGDEEITLESNDDKNKRILIVEVEED